MKKINCQKASFLLPICETLLSLYASVYLEGKSQDVFYIVLIAINSAISFAGFVGTIVLQPNIENMLNTFLPIYFSQQLSNVCAILMAPEGASKGNFVWLTLAVFGIIAVIDMLLIKKKPSHLRALHIGLYLICIIVGVSVTVLIAA